MGPEEYLLPLHKAKGQVASNTQKCKDYPVFTACVQTEARTKLMDVVSQESPLQVARRLITWCLMFILFTHTEGSSSNTRGSCTAVSPHRVILPCPQCAGWSCTGLLHFLELSPIHSQLTFPRKDYTQNIAIDST